MKPDWDRLMKTFENSADLLVADVDCTAEGKSKCTEMSIRSFPSIMYGSPGATLTKYSGGRGFDELKSFAEGLVGAAPAGAADSDDPDLDPDLADDFVPGARQIPKLPEFTTTTTTTTQCHLGRLDLCSRDFKAKAQEYRGLSLAQIDGLMKAKAARKAKNEAEGKEFLEDNVLTLLQEVRDEMAQQNLERGEL